MKFTSILFQQHVGRMFRDHWKIQGKKKVVDSGALKVLASRGLEYEDALEVVKEKPLPRKEFQLKHYIPSAPAFGENHPDYNETPCLTYGDRNVLLEGINQAKVLTNTIELEAKTLPLFEESSIDQESTLQDKLVRRCIRSSFLYDATQEKLPIRKDPLREAWRFPRDYGITDKRRNFLLVNRLLQLCSSFSPQLLGQRSVVHSAKFVVPVTLPSQQRILFSATGNAVVFADKNPSVGNIQQNPSVELPDISPLMPTVSLEQTNIYKFEPIFPLNNGAKLNKIHTVMLHFNETEVANIFESPVTTDQILGRSLMQAWIFAMSQAIEVDHGELVEPITVQLVHTNGQFFHFSVLQLNTTSCASGSSSPRNFFWSFPIMNIMENCSYQKGIPVLEGYNPNVFKTLLAFYNN